MRAAVALAALLAARRSEPVVGAAGMAGPLNRNKQPGRQVAMEVILCVGPGGVTVLSSNALTPCRSLSPPFSQVY